MVGQDGRPGCLCSTRIAGAMWVLLRLTCACLYVAWPPVVLISPLPIACRNFFVALLSTYL
jgi:hypothetical protein